VGHRGASFVAIFALNVPFPLIVLVAGMVGYAGAAGAGTFVIGGGHGAARQPMGRR
jgi:chromate transporter